MSETDLPERHQPPMSQPEAVTSGTPAPPAISVVIPCYNAEKWVGRAIQSVLDQPGVAPEVIVIDDGSTDGSLAIIEKFAKNSPVPVRFSRNEENLHFTGNFLHAASLCRGDYVALSRSHRDPGHSLCRTWSESLRTTTLQRWLK